jgi:hypothetical protein
MAEAYDPLGLPVTLDVTDDPLRVNRAGGCGVSVADRPSAEKKCEGQNPKRRYRQDTRQAAVP